MSTRERRIVVSAEQALSMSYATQRFVQLGWRVIRVEATPRAGQRSRGDPNRYIGRAVAGEDRHSYYVGPNVGKQAVAVDLKREEGRELLHRLIRELPVDVFCTNTLPARHRDLGFDYETLDAVRPGLIWCCISAMGLSYPEVPGYDPIMQALCGYMDITGHPDGPPLQCGPPLTDLKAGDEAFAQVLLALLDRAESGQGRADRHLHGACRRFLAADLSSDAGHGKLPLGAPPAGNEHRQFIPVNAYPALDGFIFLAIGSDVQWGRLVAQPLFASLDEPRLSMNRGVARRRRNFTGALPRSPRRRASRNSRTCCRGRECRTRRSRRSRK